MKFLVIGLGSMGKRRIRCFKALNCDEICGFDLKSQRCKEVEEKYNIKTYVDIDLALKEFKPDAFIISVPPHKHHIYMMLAIENQIDFFVEASVVDDDMEIIKENIKNSNIIAAPSATLCFHPAIKIIANLVKKNELGEISNILLHSGQYLPDWHNYESVSDYYVSNPATGGGREIVPFELTWITQIFGFPKRVCGNYRKTINIKGAESIDDTYNCLLDYDDYLAVITVDVVSRHATRRLMINGDKKQLIWDWDLNCIKLFNPINNQWEEIKYEMEKSEQGYNANIGENMYIDEIKCFLDSIEKRVEFINTIENDHKVLKLLYAVEEADKTSKYVMIK